MKPFNFTSRSHPKFFRYVTENMPDVAKVPVIAQAMQRNGFLGSKAFRDALSAGHPPLLVLVSNLVNPGGNKRNGFTPASPPVPLKNGFMPPANSILLEKQLADDFESGKPKLVDTVADDPANNRRIYLAGVTILHELCHWEIGKRTAGSPMASAAWNMANSSSSTSTARCWRSAILPATDWHYFPMLMS